MSSNCRPALRLVRYGAIADTQRALFINGQPLFIPGRQQFIQGNGLFINRLLSTAPCRGFAPSVLVEDQRHLGAGGDAIASQLLVFGPDVVLLKN